MEELIELQKSQYIQERNALLAAKNIIPKLSVCRTNLGTELANVVFEHCPQALKQLFGLEPPLQGAGDELWVSPSDLLIGKVCLKPPLTSKHIQALTHAGILEIGEGVEMKFWNEMGLEIEKQLHEQKIVLDETYETELKRALKDFELQARAACEQKMEKMNQEFNLKLKDELKKLESRMLKQTVSSKRNTVNKLNRFWKQKLKMEVDKTVKKMSEDFLKDLHSQQDLVQQEFVNMIKNKEQHARWEIELERARGQERLREMKHQLECLNVSNMMYVLCMERRRCANEINEIQEHFNNKLKNLAKMQGTQKNVLQEMTRKIQEQTKQLEVRDMCIKEVIGQFQKFINFALRSAPMQSQFLLSLEKLLLYELTETILDKKDVITKVAKEAKEIKTWKCPKSNSTATSSVRSLTIKDHHNCFNEPEPFVENSGQVIQDFLPAFYYKDNMYVREDFRNMISQGLTIHSSNELWNKDMEILMLKLTESASQDLKDSEPRPVKFRATISDVILPPRHEPSEEQKIGKRALKKKRSFEKIITPITSAEPRVSLLGSRNSLELIRKKIPSLTLQTRSETGGKMNLIEQLKPDLLETDKRSSKSKPVFNDQLTHKILSTELIDKQKRLSSDLPQGKIRSVLKSNVQDFSLQVPSVEKKAEEPIRSTLERSSLQEKDRKFSRLELSRDSMVIHKASATRKISNTSLKNSVSKILERNKEIRTSLQLQQYNLYPINASVQDDRTSSTVRKCWNCFCADKQTSTDVIGLYKRLTANKELYKNENSFLRNLSKSIIDTKESARKILNNEQIDELLKIYEKSCAKKIKPVVKRKINRKKRVTSKRSTNGSEHLKVVGDPDGKEYLQNVEEFTADRIHSFLNIIKNYPNLIGTFTACTR